MVNPLKKAAEAVASVLPTTITSTTTTKSTKPTSSRPSEISLPSTSSSELLKSFTNKNGTDAEKVPQTPRTPKTPADEAIAFFSSETKGKGEEVVQIFELSLEDDGGPDSARSYIRLPPPTTPYILRISLAPGSVATRNGILKSDFPMDGGAFKRGDWKERKMPTDVTKPIKVDLPISAPGAFCYYIEHDDDYVEGRTSSRVQTRKGYFNVDPIITLPARTPIFGSQSEGKDISHTQPGAILKDGSFGKVSGEGKQESIPLDSIAMLSVIAKWQGPLDNWSKYYEESARRGYNFIHYTPLQSRGNSGSPYSIYDQLTFDNELLKGGKDSEGDGGVKQVGEVLKFAKERFGLGSLTDVVLNHTANNSPWLEDHPEAGFSPTNSPHLSGAFELDTAMIELSGQLAQKGLPTSVNSQSDLDRLAGAVEETLHSLNLWQFYVIDVAAEKKAVASASVKGWSGESVEGKSNEELVDIAKRNNVLKGYRSYAGRFPTKSDPAAAAGFVKAARPNEDVAEAWGRICDIANVDLYREAGEDLKAAKENIVGRLRYTRLDAHGPRLGEISSKSPLIEPYFTRVPQKAGTNHSAETLGLANNGWIWAADPLASFADYPGKSYVRRELIAWSDCVKLRYGNGPEDNPWLWSHMQNYCELLAEMFDGFRLDNCHSTPLHVGVKMIDTARAVNPNLYVMAELFTGSQEMDLRFVSQIGINSLVREAYNGGTPKDFSSLLYEFGVPKAIGSMAGAVLSKREEFVSPTGKGGVRSAMVTPLAGSKPHAIMYDVTHDNETPYDKRTAEDALATGALVTFTSAAIGSNKGFDDLYPKILDLVNDKRMYEVATAEQENGIGKVKRVLNELHRELATGGYVEGHVHQENDYIVMHRVHPVTHKGYLLVAHTAFNKGARGRGHISPFKLSHQEVTFLFGASLTTNFDQFKESDKTFKSIPNELVEITDVKVHQGQDESGPYSEVVVPDNFEPGSILLFGTSMNNIPTDLDSTIVEGALGAFADLDLVELNVVMYRSDGEERDATGDGAYDIPGLGTPPYCGLEGWMSHLRHIVEHNDLGHPLCAHLRSGCWAMSYIVDRLVRQTNEFPGLQKPAEWLKKRFDQIQAVVPSFLRPKYFSLVVYEAYKAARTAAIEQMSEFVSSGNEFTQDLALTAVQLHGQVKSASIDPSKPVPSLAAGLPHFSAGWARCWGRDVLIALRGLFLTTGNFEAARAHILAFGSTLKHGLIPNLLDSCRNPRYNCRDGPWWFCQNVQDYTKMSPNGESILQESVKRRFPKDDTWIPWDDARAYSYSSTVAELIQEILQRHAQGIEFREYNAGPNLDNDMKDEGFNQKIFTDWSTGFIIGGNRFSCGTWMDKMGSSAKAGNKGLPATPRDGAAVEITGLLASTLIWVDSLAGRGAWPAKGVDVQIDGKQRLITYKEWSSLLHANFERYYWVPISPSEDSDFEVKTNLINRRGIYKDVYGTTDKEREYEDYRLRCNAALPMIVAPSLFTPERARHHLKLADENLRDELGMKTLDPSDMAYRPNYDNSNDSDDMSMAKGWSYHSGPPWGFPLGWHCSGLAIFDRENPHLPHHISSIFLKLHKHLKSNPWKGLEELTNANGAICFDSCHSQSWSQSTILDVLEEMYRQNKEQ